MPKICYIERNFRQATLDTIQTAEEIIQEYVAQGFDLTLRQLYYQMVARGYIENSMRSYKNFGSIIDDARLAGLIDWDSIVDRTRNLRRLSHFDDPRDVMNAAVHSYRLEKWADQEYAPEVWVEKDALIGVIGGVCEELDVPYFACRGYTSQSEMWAAGQRMIRAVDNGKTPMIFHLGDHDPSGIDMTRDILDRLELFVGERIEVERLALNFDQVARFNPPPNPAKLEDSRAEGYIAQFGYSSWELDALDPTTISNLIRSAIESVIDFEAWTAVANRESGEKTLLRKAARNWTSVAEFLQQG